MLAMCLTDLSSSLSTRFVPTTSPPMMHQMDHMGQYGPSSPMNLSNHAYYGSQQPHVSQYYGGGPMPPVPAHRHNMNYYQNHMLMGQSQPGYYYPQNVQYAPPNQNMQASIFSGQYMPTSPTTANGLRAQIDHHPDPRWLGQDRRGPDEQDRQQTSAVRGPPRKPRQSGHAIWVGNLPPQTELMSLVHHVCKEAPGLESLFLISKSNCAFANFKDDATCAAAQQKLHDSKFQSVRLVSRLRKSTVEGATGATAPTGPAGLSTASTSTVPTNEDKSTVVTETSEDPTGEEAQTARLRQVVVDGGQQDKFFILKSLTVEDLERSVKTGMWATQSHNEDTLNNAFKTTDNVYLVFSANKSGEYFGYARMASEINQDPDAAIEFAPKAQMTTDTDLPKAIPTEATEHAPKGRIIDDSARGTIFWEVEHDEAEDEEDETQNKETDEEEDQKTWDETVWVLNEAQRSMEVKEAIHEASSRRYNGKTLRVTGLSLQEHGPASMVMMGRS
ncbi:uncharacterized protein J7T54_006338 [Emericellopsis cladophorae]|uniref:YTH domain-containing protein n=1 Tax=Emericellopsis cladophorae TaxID=2686198 RepID=A0A9P9YAH1_9HYPO|nr:uncharacterized protein J7T54_006338 [Emericellopsis cladophorae]KAI6785999.1 hypothetical protein J7T54_006338 [Emericellopsis cladophorae]